MATNLLALEAYCAGAPIIRVVQHPFWTQLMRQWDDGFLIYDMMDDHSGFLGNGAWLPEQEQELLRQQIWSRSRPICWRPRLGTLRRASLSKMRPIVTTSSLLPYDAPVMSPVRMGYYGAISHWFDSALVSESAKAHP